MAGTPPTITRVVIENYKSIAHCDVELGALTFLVGRNDAGKSNLLDALRFVSDALHGSLDTAIRDRGNFQDLHFRGADPNAPIVLRLEMVLPDERTGEYSVSLTQDANIGYKVAEECCTIHYPATGHQTTGFRLRNGFHIDHPNWPEGVPAVQPQQLYLPLSTDMSGRTPVYNVLSTIVAYDPIPAHMRGPERHDQGDRLLPDGRNCASVLLHLATKQPNAIKRIREYLQAIIPGLQQVRGVALGGYDVLEFIQQVAGREQTFPPNSVSAGTLHALAVLTAIFQGVEGGPQAPSLVAIEEPEVALNALATSALLDALRDASENVQVLVTTHSPDILDDKDVDGGSILAVVKRNGTTIVGPLDAADRSVVQDRLYTVGDLMRQGALEPEVVEETLTASVAGVR